jgi:hypothetical protein
MNNLGIDFTADLQGAISDLPNTITIGNREYDCVADEERSSIDVQNEGVYEMFDRNVHLPLSSVASVPAKRAVVSVDEKKYYVHNVNRQPESDTLILVLRREDGSTAEN